MKTTFTKEYILAHCGCYIQTKALKYLTKEEFTIGEILDFNVSLNDKGWFILNACELTYPELREFAIGCALCVLPIYEAKYPDNKAPREAIQAVKDYLAGIIGLDALREKRNAAAYAAAAAAADAAAYADAAADKTDYQIILLNFFKSFMTTKPVTV